MAFFATTEDMPMSRAAWEPRRRNIVNPKPPKPPIRRPRKPRGRGASVPYPWILGVVSESRVRTPVIRKPRRVKPISWVTRGRESANDQIRGRRKPRRIPPAVVVDKLPVAFFNPPRGGHSYKPLRARYNY